MDDRTTANTDTYLPLSVVILQTADDLDWGEPDLSIQPSGRR